MSDFRINPGMEYYVIIHPTIDRSRAVAVTTMGDNILIQGGLVQFGMKDIKTIKNDADGIASAFRRFYSIPLLAPVQEYETKTGRPVPLTLSWPTFTDCKYRVNSSGYQSGIFRLEVCRLFIPELCRYDSFPEVVAALMKLHAEKLDDTFKPYAQELIEKYVAGNKNFMEKNNG